MPIDRDDREERDARIDALLEEARLKGEALAEHARKIKDRARKMRRQAKADLAAARRPDASKKPASGR